MEQLYVTTPVAHLIQAFETFPDLAVAPEIFINANDLRQPDTLASFHAIARRLQDLEMSCTIHGPFIDLSPGGFDPDVVALTNKRFLQTFELAAIIHPRVVVFHSGYDRWKYALNLSLWLENSKRFWTPLLEEAEKTNTFIALENIFEVSPIGLKTLFEALDSPRLGACFDVGHWHLFGTTTLDEWLTVLGPHIFAFHLHDNAGEADDHLVPGEGTIDFMALKQHTSALQIKPLSYTFEPHNRQDIARGVAWFRQNYGL
ncbi:MAG: sugar phosphate isomerase/epimerase [Deltaproteobacteria bacterium]|nr:sugar phosphate isomerase/epimerase [Candidatus Anaeroferrophillus wilburensis]MBN2889134.1 sugar phosphate isomerase/epimerase [Deltaproteobacteria bacterium]